MYMMPCGRVNSENTWINLANMDSSLSRVIKPFNLDELKKKTNPKTQPNRKTAPLSVACLEDT